MNGGENMEISNIGNQMNELNTLAKPVQKELTEATTELVKDNNANNVSEPVNSGTKVIRSNSAAILEKSGESVNYGTYTEAQLKGQELSTDSKLASSLNEETNSKMAVSVSTTDEDEETSEIIFEEGKVIKRTTTTDEDGNETTEDVILSGEE